MISISLFAILSRLTYLLKSFPFVLLAFHMQLPPLAYQFNYKSSTMYALSFTYKSTLIKSGNGTEFILIQTQRISA